MKKIIMILALLSSSAAFGVNVEGWYTSTRGSDLTVTYEGGNCFQGDQFERFSYRTYYPRLRKSYSGFIRVNCDEGPQGHYAMVRSSSGQTIDGVYCNRTQKFTWYNVNFGRWGNYTIEWYK